MTPTLSTTCYLRMLARAYLRAWRRWFFAARVIPLRAASPIFRGDTEVAAARRDAGATGMDAGAAASVVSPAALPPVLFGPGGAYQTPWPAASAGLLDVTEDSQ